MASKRNHQMEIHVLPSIFSLAGVHGPAVWFINMDLPSDARHGFGGSLTAVLQWHV